MAITDAGENKAWELLAAGDAAQVCARAGVSGDPENGGYRIRSFGSLFFVDPRERTIQSYDPRGEVLLKRYDYLLRLSLLWYLVKASDARPSGSLVKPSRLLGGEMFFKGAHVLPLAEFAAKYAARAEAFLKAGAALAGKPVAYGDAAIELLPLPKIPTTLILWTEDDEFPARADLLFDVTAPRHLPMDILWSVAMISLLPLL